MHRGFIKLWRKSVDSGMFREHRLWTVWSYLLLKASHKPDRIRISNFHVDIRAGEYAFSSRELADILGLTVSQLKTALNTLTKRSQINQKTTRHYTLISIVNWKRYQPDKASKRSHSDHRTIKGSVTYTDLEEYKEGGEATPPVDPQLIGVIEWIEKKEMEEDQ